MVATTVIGGQTFTLSGSVAGTLQGGSGGGGSGSGEIVPAFATVGASNSAGWAGYTVRMIVQPSLIIGVSRPCLRFRARLFGSTLEAYKADKLYVGHKSASGAAWDAVPMTPVLASMTPVLFGGSAAGVAPAGGFIESDWCSFAWDRTSAIVLSWYGNTAAQDAMREKGSLAGCATYYKQGADLASAAVPGVSFGLQNATGAYGVMEFDIEQEAA